MTILNDDRKVSDVFGYWLAGFTDGEGHFCIARDKRGSPDAQYRCRFKIDLRDDDKAILEEIHETLGIGIIRDKRACLNDSRDRRRQVRFDVNAIKDCAKLVEIFNWYPLRAKKRRDFSIWRCAVFELQKPVVHRNAKLLEYYFHKIREVRQYEKQPELEKPVIVDTQLLIEF